MIFIYILLRQPGQSCHPHFALLSVLFASLSPLLSLCFAGLLAPLVMANPNLVSLSFFTPLIVPLKNLDSFVCMLSLSSSS